MRSSVPQCTVLANAAGLLFFNSFSIGICSVCETSKFVRSTVLFRTNGLRLISNDNHDKDSLLLDIIAVNTVPQQISVLL